MVDRGGAAVNPRARHRAIEPTGRRTARRTRRGDRPARPVPISTEVAAANRLLFPSELLRRVDVALWMTATESTRFRRNLKPRFSARRDSFLWASELNIKSTPQFTARARRRRCRRWRCGSRRRRQCAHIRPATPPQSSCRPATRPSGRGGVRRGVQSHRREPWEASDARQAGSRDNWKSVLPGGAKGVWAHDIGDICRLCHELHIDRFRQQETHRCDRVLASGAALLRSVNI